MSHLFLPDLDLDNKSKHQHLPVIKQKTGNKTHCSIWTNKPKKFHYSILVIKVIFFLTAHNYNHNWLWLQNYQVSHQKHSGQITEAAHIQQHIIHIPFFHITKTAWLKHFTNSEIIFHPLNYMKRHYNTYKQFHSWWFSQFAADLDNAYDT